MQARARESEALARLLASAAAGAGGALVVHGDAGMGKTALVDDALDSASGLRVLRADGAEFEQELPHAALHQLCAAVLDNRSELPDPQRAALESVFGLRVEGTPEPLLVGLAVLGLLSEVSRTEPVVCVIEDAQWIDTGSRQALAFAARRIEAERIAMLFTLRDPDATPELTGLDRLPIAGLGEADARALLELPRGAGPVGLAGGFAGVGAEGVSGAMEEEFARRAADLPSAARDLLLLAAAEPLGDPVLLRRAAEGLGVPGEAWQAAEASGLLSLGPRIRFRHPLVRSAAYRAASPSQRRDAHSALAAATDPDADPDRRAWHRAQAAVDPDEDVAAELERSADRARSRGGLAAAAAFLERAAELTPEPRPRAARTVAAARLELRAGAPGEALALLERVQEGALAEDERAEVRLVRASVTNYVRRDGRATAELLAAADGLPPDSARETYLEAFAYAMVVEHDPQEVQQLARRVRARGRRESPRPADLLLDALTSQTISAGSAAVPVMRRAVAALREVAVDPSGDPRWIQFASIIAIDLYDDASVEVLAEEQVDLARQQGALAVLPEALNFLAVARTLAGDLREAAVTVAEAHAIGEATGGVGLAFGDVILAAWRGDRARVDALFAVPGGGDDEGRHERQAELYARAVLFNGLGDYESALAAALQADEQERLGAYTSWHLAPELVEAASRAGRPGEAVGALERIVDRCRASGTDWALGTELRSRALLTDGLDADALHLEAIDRLARSRVATALARARLVYGEWLRRRQRRVEARSQLRDAHDAFVAMGAEGFATRAARELLATGEHPRKRTVDLLDALTPQEIHIARHVASGATSKEVAAELFLSPRTIDAHLRSIFRKLDISSRRQLRDLEL